MQNTLVDKYYLVKLKKLHGETDEQSGKNLIGYAPYLPTATQPFILFGKREDGLLRVVKTSTVTCSFLVNETELSFDCGTNTYYLHILDEATPEEVESFLSESVSKNNPALDKFMANLDIDQRPLN